jgi:hypothetical protein
MRTRNLLLALAAGVILLSLYSIPRAQVGAGRPMPTAAPDAPVVEPLTRAPEDHDYPAIAQSGDNIYVAYVQFAHSDLAAEKRRMEAGAQNFDFLSRPAGGDQVFLLTGSKSKRTWSAPVAVSAPQQDIFRTAVAADAGGRVWVFWSANKNGNFDIYARSAVAGKWSGETRLTTDPGSDLNPVAATDAKGRVWIAWQAYRSGNLEILAAAQQGDGFTSETTVSFSKSSDWDPAIAAAPNGEVAVSWDTYDKGDYDVYFRRLRWDGRIRLDAPVPVAASRNFEARSSIAYDAGSRLWVAYEASAAKWGKDFGAYESTGVSLYQDHTFQVKCFQGAQALAAPGDLQSLLPASATGAAVGGRRSARELPDNAIATDRAPNATAATPNNFPLISFPHIASGAGGTVYVAYRRPIAGRTTIGLGWSEELVYFDGAKWQGPVGIPSSSNYIDARPAMAVIAPNDLLMIDVTDHRREESPGATKAGKKKKKAASPEPEGGAETGPVEIRNDLYAVEFRSTPAAAATLDPLPTESVAARDPDDIAEQEQIALIRKHRLTVGTQRLQLMRGEFHRHTELSGHGRDGPVIDAYRYMIDAASMDWGGCCDHDNGLGREYPWWMVQKLSDAYHLGTSYVPMFVYERSVAYPEGHRNVVFPRRGIRPLPRLPISHADSPSAPAPDTQMLYQYLRQYGGVVASHTSGTDMGTDWRDNDPLLEPVVEIYQGDRQNYEMPAAPRSNSADDSIGGWRPLGFVSLALKKGYRLGFEASSDHTSTHMSYCNLWVTSPTRDAIMEAFRKRRIYGATDNILADVRSGGHFMGEEFTTAQPPAIAVKLWGSDKFAKVHIVKDGEYVYSVEPNSKTVDFTWKDGAAEKGKTSYYYVRGEQANGELVWVSPMWITYK